MAGEVTKEKVVIQFDTNANSASKDVQGLNASIEQTNDVVTENSKAVENQEQAYKSLKVQLREAIVEQQKLSSLYGSTSKEAIGATKAVAGIKDEIQFQKDLVKSYNPDEKFRGLSQTAGVAALALGGVKDGFTALGIESKTLDKIIGSAQAILGVTSAVSGMSDAYAVLNSSKKIKVATDVAEIASTEALTVAEGQATVATWTWNSALLANPIVLIAAGIVAATAIIYAFIKITGDAVTSEEKAETASYQLSVAIENQSKSYENQNNFLSKNNEHKLALLKASGANEAQIYKETKALAEQELQLAKNYRAEALILEQKAYEQNRDNPTEFTAKTLKSAQENVEKAKIAVSVGYDGLINLQQQHQVATIQSETDARNKEIEKQKEHQKEVKRLGKEAYDKKMADLKAFNEDVLKEIGKMNVQKVEQEVEQGVQDKLDEQERKDESAAKAFEAGDAVYEQLKKEVDDKKRLDEIVLQNKKENNEKLISGGEQLIKNISTLAGKNKAIQKAAIIADGGVSIGKAISNTAEAVTKDLAKGVPASIPFVALDLAVGATSVASIISGTSKALQAVGGGSAPTAPSLPSAPTGVAAQPQVGFQASSENQISTSINNSQQNLPPIKTYVVGSEVTTQQNLDSKLIKENSFG